MKNKFNKKKIKIILEEIKEGFESEVKSSNRHISLSLCARSTRLSWKDHLLFKRYLYYINRHKKVYYRPSNSYPYKIVKCDAKKWFHWHPSNFDARLKWLNKHIRLNSGIEEMTEKEQLKLYMKKSKKEICEMLIKANKHLKNLPTSNRPIYDLDGKKVMVKFKITKYEPKIFIDEI